MILSGTGLPSGTEASIQTMACSPAAMTAGPVIGVESWEILKCEATVAPLSDWSTRDGWSASSAWTDATVAGSGA